MRRIEMLKLTEDLESPKARVKFFSKLTNEEFRKFFGYINSITRGEKIDYDYEDGQLPALVTPPLENKEELMNQAFAAVREILSQEDDGDDEDVFNRKLRRAALTLAGAINYIHPKKDGNGRVARVLHYLMEYGTDRGEKLFEDELYSIIAKNPTYKVDVAQPIHNSPPSKLEWALSEYARQHDELYDTLNERGQAAYRVRVFLHMMKGDIQVPIDQEVSTYPKLYEDSERKKDTIPSGELSGDELYEREYLAYSMTPNRSPDEVSPDAEKTKPKRSREIVEDTRGNILRLELV